MLTYRIANCQYIHDLSGRGAALYGGRWNSKETYMLYTAESASLALLEAVVHIGKMPQQGFCMLSLDIPDDSIFSYAADDLPKGWHTNPTPEYLRRIGDSFITAGKHLVLKVPSAIMPVEHNYLINPAHRDFKKVKIASTASITIDGRLVR